MTIDLKQAFLLLFLSQIETIDTQGNKEIVLETYGGMERSFVLPDDVAKIDIIFDQGSNPDVQQIFNGFTIDMRVTTGKFFKHTMSDK